MPNPSHVKFYTVHVPLIVDFGVYPIAAAGIIPEGSIVLGAYARITEVVHFDGFVPRIAILTLSALGVSQWHVHFHDFADGQVPGLVIAPKALTTWNTPLDVGLDTVQGCLTTGSADMYALCAEAVTHTTGTPTGAVDVGLWVGMR